MILKTNLEKKLNKFLQPFLKKDKINLFPIKEKKFGDFYSPILFKKNISFEEKEKLAKKIIDFIENDKNLNKIFEKIEFQQPGFLNFFLSKDILFSELKKIIKKNTSLPQKKEKIILEFISANPTGPLTFANARGGFWGDSLKKILQKTGYNVYSEYFINDAKTSKQIKELGKTAIGKGKSYLTPRIKELIKKIPKNKLKDEITAGKTLADIIQKENKKFIEKTLKIKFDNWFSEESLYKNKEIEKLLFLLKKKNLTYQKNRALFLKTSDFGDSEDRVIVRSDNTPTYFLADIAYHLNKFKRGFNLAIDIWGADHQGHIKRMEAALKSLNILPKKKFKVITVQMVNLKKSGKIKKMSKRKGEYLELEELVKLVSLDVARFLVLSKSSSTHFDFDLDLALEKSKKNPVYYLQYSWVRSQSIFKKVGQPKYNFKSLKYLENNYEVNLLRMLLNYQLLLEQVSIEFSVHKIAHYVLDLAKVFNQFYENCPIFGQEKNIKEARLILLKGFEFILKDALDILGVSLPKKM